mmetsp:Transcript_26114/g.32639  ORF Transcript_26114/g.32639 Transcript_26114/m.32639 type:complete len:111 (+) Transcript_26114:207-539(+)
MEGESNFMVVQHLMEQYDPKQRPSNATRPRASLPRNSHMATTSRGTAHHDSETLVATMDQPIGRVSTLIYKQTRRDSEFLNEYSKAASPKQAALIKSRLSIEKEQRTNMD